METNLYSWKEARKVEIQKVLQDLKVLPERSTSKGFWYLSPLRKETRPSFFVSKMKNLWYDFGIGKGGNAIDLVVNLKQCSPWEALHFLSGYSSFFFNTLDSAASTEEKEIQVLEVKAIQHPALVQYLKSRSITPVVARRFCQEIWYSYRSKTYFSIGLQNEAGGWEMRNKFFKNSAAPKSYSFISHKSRNLLIFEGMFDFLSLATLEKSKIASADCLILNSLAFLDKSFLILDNYDKVYTYLDNDSAGKEANKRLIKNCKTVIDCSSFYEDHKDLNEKLVLLKQQF